MVTDEARRLFAVVVDKLYMTNPDLVPSDCPFALHGDHGKFSCFPKSQLQHTPAEYILAAAALCAEWMPNRQYVVDFMQSNDGQVMWRVVDSDDPSTTVITVSAHDDWPSAQFAAILAEKGIEHD